MPRIIACAKSDPSRLDLVLAGGGSMECSMESCTTVFDQSIPLSGLCLVRDDLRIHLLRI
ncbi:hypothetical protein LIA77_05228 [Sarocladium implicatum]|nr:hypothetical protein LIA77_05228 [Sarocladium implicatum]